jgi:hypothetical protein
MQVSRKKIVLRGLLIVAIVGLIALPIWRGTGTGLPSP